MTPADLRRIRRERCKAKGMRDSRDAFAEISGIPVRTLARLETGETPITRRERLVIAALLYDLKPYGEESPS